MPFQYLEPTSESIYAINRMGDAFSNAIIGSRIAQQRAYQAAQQHALDQAYFQLQQQKQQAELPGIQARGQGDVLANQLAQQTMAASQRSGRLGTQAALPPEALAALIRDPATMAQMATDLRASGAVPQGAYQMQAPPGGVPPELVPTMLAALRGGAVGVATENPASAQRMLDPQVVGRNQIGFDPFSRQPVIQGGPGMKTPHEAAMEAIQSEHYKGIREGEQEKLEQQRKLDIAKAIAAAVKPGRGEDTADADARMQRVNDIFAQAFGGGGADATIAPEVADFDSEEAARSAGKKTGDIIRIKGVGKVQLQ